MGCRFCVRFLVLPEDNNDPHLWPVLLHIQRKGYNGAIVFGSLLNIGKEIGDAPEKWHLDADRAIFVNVWRNLATTGGDLSAAQFFAKLGDAAYLNRGGGGT